MKRNPPWTREELLLALELYFVAGRRQLPSTDQQVKELSDLLDTLKIHTVFERGERFRNPSGVSMKLGNFLSLDPEYSGSGMRNVSSLDREIWEEFAHHQSYLSQVADQIRKANESLEYIGFTDANATDDDEFKEGRLITRLHTFRERNPSAVKRKKDSVLKRTGALKCEVCEFDFREFYGQIGEGFAECHHKIPLSELTEIGTTRTRLLDLSIVCANCHRMLHRSRPALSVTKLRDRFKGRDDST